jgi:hypothetical protein
MLMFNGLLERELRQRSMKAWGTDPAGLSARRKGGNVRNRLCAGVQVRSFSEIQHRVVVVHIPS